MACRVGGGLEGLVIGAAAGLGYGLTTAHLNGGLAAPRGRRRVLTVGGDRCRVRSGRAGPGARRPAAGRRHDPPDRPGLAGSQATLTPLGRLIGEPDFGPLTAALIATGEGALFGLGLALGLTRR